MASSRGVWGGTPQSECHTGGDAFIINSEAIEFNGFFVSIGNGWPVATLDRQLWEIDENLMRAELSPTEMAEHLAKRGDRYADYRIGAGFAFDCHICYATGGCKWSSGESQLRRFRRRSKPCFLRHRCIFEGQCPLIPRSPPFRDRGEDYG